MPSRKKGTRINKDIGSYVGKGPFTCYNFTTFKMKFTIEGEEFVSIYVNAI
jgi:hypothetical protein